MARVFLADAQPEEPSAPRLLLLDLNMEVVGEAADWPTTLAQASATNPGNLCSRETGQSRSETVLRARCGNSDRMDLRGPVGELAVLLQWRMCGSTETKERAMKDGNCPMCKSNK